jgi:hypothetical protein
MGRTKPNKPSESPNKHIEEQDKQDPSINVTPQPATSRKNKTETEHSETPQTESYRTNIQIKDINKNDTSMINSMDKMDRERRLRCQQPLYRDDDLLTTMDIIEHVNHQEDNISQPRMGQESSPTQDDQKMAAQNSYTSSPHSTNRKNMLSYSHSRNPRARLHGRTDKPKRPESHPTKEFARARERCLNIEPNYYYCPITLVMS